MKNKILILLLLILLSGLAVWPLLHSGFFPIHDDTQATRIFEMGEALKDGQFPVRTVSDLGYGFGYPIFNFYGPLAYYFGGLINVLGFEVLTTSKIIFGLGILFSGISMFLLARKFWGNWGGIISALFYVYAPYRAVDLYVRGAMGELWAMVFLPLVFLDNIWISGLALAGVILSHNLTALMLIPFLVMWFVVRKKIEGIISMLVGLGISAFYWLPALVEMNLTKVTGQIGGGADFRDHFVFWDQLWASPWGFGGSAPGRFDGMSFMIGKVHLITLGISLILIIYLWLTKKKEKKAIWIIAFGAFVLSLLFTNEITKPIWENLKLMAYIQYPWRFLTLAIFWLSLAVGIIGKGVYKIAILVILTVVLVGFNQRYFKPLGYLNISDSSYTTRENINWKVSRISDEYLPKNFKVPQDETAVAKDKILGVNIISQQTSSIKQEFEVETPEVAQVILNTAYFPWWKVKVDGEEVTPTIIDGRMAVRLSPGQHTININYVSTPIQTQANYISLIALIGLIFFQFLGVRKKRSGIL